jgi:hypothetical protein
MPASMLGPMYLPRTEHRPRRRVVRAWKPRARVYVITVNHRQRDKGGHWLRQDVTQHCRRQAFLFMVRLRSISRRT